MMNRLRYILLLIWVVPWVVLAQIPERPNPPRLVNDFAEVLNGEEQQLLEETLVQFDRETSTQVVVVTVSSLQGYDKADFAYRIGESWGVGQKDRNNGIIVLIKPKIENEPGQVYIAVGYGLEAVIPDAVANRLIVNNEMIPRFRENDYFGGIKNGVKVIADLTRGEFTAEQYSQSSGSGKGAGGFIIVLLVMLLVIFPLMKKSRKVHSGGTRTLPFWLLLGMMSSGKKHGGHWNDFSSGRGSFGGGSFGKGGFGGFGGGSFGGGGAGGSW
jgi:uncharacterized protein